MVSNEVVLQTVKRMVATGVDDSTIRMTLKGINLADADIDSVIAEARGGMPGKAGRQQSQPAAAASEEEQVDYEGEAENSGDGSEGGEYEGEGEENSTDELKSQIQGSSQEQMAHHETTHNILEEHSDKMEQMHSDITALHRKIDAAPRLSSESIAQLNALGARISALEKEIGETKANTIALQGLLQKILETDRKALLELQKK